MTRLKRVMLPCPRCGTVQEATAVYSWNEARSGPMPPDAGTATCAECGHRFDPFSQQDHWEDPPRQPMEWLALVWPALIILALVALLVLT